MVYVHRYQFLHAAELSLSTSPAVPSFILAVNGCFFCSTSCWVGLMGASSDKCRLILGDDEGLEDESLLTAVLTKAFTV